MSSIQTGVNYHSIYEEIQILRICVRECTLNSVNTESMMDDLTMF